MTIYQIHKDGSKTKFEDGEVTNGTDTVTMSHGYARRLLTKSPDELKIWGLVDLPTRNVFPTIDDATQKFADPVHDIGEKEVTRTYQVVEKTIDEKVDYIKSKAGADIVAIMPEHKQRNNIAKGVELLMAVVLQGHKPTPEEAAEMTAGLQLWAAIKAIRDKSNADEAAVKA